MYYWAHIVRESPGLIFRVNSGITVSQMYVYKELWKALLRIWLNPQTEQNLPKPDKILKNKIKFHLSLNVSLLGCLPLLAISSCYSWPFLLLQPFLSPHCVVWEKTARLKCTSVALLLWILFLKQRRIGELFMAWRRNVKMIPFYLQRKSLKCICVCVRECPLLTVNKSSAWKHSGQEEDWCI